MKGMRIMCFDTIPAKYICNYINKASCVIVDLREPAEFCSNHIPTAINIPYGQINDYTRYLCSYQEVVLYCARGNASLLAARYLNLGNTKVYNVYGGLQAYRGELVRGTNNI